MEVAGALQTVADLMLQSVSDGISGESFMALFPLNATFSDMRFHRYLIVAADHFIHFLQGQS